jgi:hypothetical protein
MNACSGIELGPLDSITVVMEIDSMTAVMDAFGAYARDRGIVISDAIKPHRFLGRGLGIAAARKIQVCSLFSCRLNFFIMFLMLFEFCCLYTFSRTFAQYLSCDLLSFENKFTDPLST